MRELLPISLRIAAGLVAVIAGVAVADGADRAKANPDGSKDFVGVMGQVLRPGVYEIAGPNIDAFSLVERAGGLTTNSTGELRVIRNGRAGYKALLSDGLRYELHAGDLLVIESRPLTSRGSGGPMLAPRREDIQIGLINLQERPVVLRLRAEYTTLRGLLTNLGQSLRVLSTTRMIAPDGEVVAGTAVSSSTRLKSETVLVFDPESIDPSRVPDLPPPIPFVASRSVSPPAQNDSQPHDESQSRQTASDDGSVSGTRAATASLSTQENGDSPRAHALPIGADFSQSPPPPAVDGEEPVPPPLDFGEGTRTDRKSRRKDRAARLADVEEWADKPEESDSAFTALWAFLLPILALAFFGVSWLRARRRRRRQYLDFLNTTDDRDQDSAGDSVPSDGSDVAEATESEQSEPSENTAAPPPSVREEHVDATPEPAHVAVPDEWTVAGFVTEDTPESSEPQPEPAPASSAPHRGEMLQNLIRDTVPLFEESVRPLEGIQFYGRPNELPAFRLDGPQEPKGPSAGHRADRQDEAAPPRVKPGVRPIMRHDVVEPEAAGHSVPQPHFNAAALQPRTQKAIDLSARQIAEEASSILDHALSSVEKGTSR